MKKIKLVILAILFIFITGCGYGDIYKENKDILDKLNCSYTSSNYGDYPAFPRSNYDINITADANGVYFTSEKTKINIINDSVKLGDYYLSFSESELKNFLESYKKNGCPNQFFAAGKSNVESNLYIQSTCAAGNGVDTQCFLYKLNASNEGETKNNVSTSPIYDRYIKSIKKQVQYSFSYDFNNKTSYLNVDGVKYEIKNKSLLESISQTTNAWGIEPTDYDDIFKIDETNKTVKWPELVYVMQKSADQQKVLYFTVNLKNYEIRNDYKNENESKYGNWDPNSLCGEHNENCNVNITAFCTNPYVSRTLKFLGILIAIAKILVPAIIIILGFISLTRIIISGKVDEAKKQALNIGERMIIGIIIFVMPTILMTLYNVAYSIVNDSDDSVPENFKNCVGCILDAMNGESCTVDITSKLSQGSSSQSGSSSDGATGSTNGGTFTNYLGIPEGGVGDYSSLGSRGNTYIKFDKDLLVLTKDYVDYVKVNANVKSLSWKSSNTKVATVNSKGEVRAKGAGSATITATSIDGSSAKIKVKVIKRAKYLGNEKWIIEKGDYTKQEKEAYINIADELCHSNFYKQDLNKYTFCPAETLCYYTGTDRFNLTKHYMQKDEGISATDYVVFLSSAKQTITLFHKNSKGEWKVLKSAQTSTGKTNTRNHYRHDFWLGAMYYEDGYGLLFQQFSKHAGRHCNFGGTGVSICDDWYASRAIHIGNQLGYPHSNGCGRVPIPFRDYMYKLLKNQYGTRIIYF